jgi:serine/threonine-protein kinase
VVTISVSGASSVPNVFGLTQASAEALLQSRGFKVTVDTVAGPAGTQPGNVWQQTPNANTTSAQGTTVTILVQPAAATPSGSPSAPASPTDSGSPPAGGGGNGNGNGGGGFLGGTGL